MGIEDYNYPVDKNIRKIIKDKCYKQTVIAQELGLTRQQFSDMVHGRKVIRLGLIPQIAEILDVTLEELFEK